MVKSQFSSNILFVEKHSQKYRTKPLNAWCTTTKDGSIFATHFLCMDKNNEVCCHTVALLFTLEFTNNEKTVVSSTDVKYSWPVPSVSAQAPIVPVCQMN